MFKAQRFSRERPTETIAETAGKVPILGQTLEERQDWAVLLAKGEWSKEGEPAQLWIREDVFITAKAIELFIKTAEDASGDVHWRAKDRVGAFVEEICLGDTTPMMIWLQEARHLNDEDVDNAQELLVETKMQLIDLDVPKSQFGVDLIQLPLSDFIVLPTGHWSQLLWANLLSMGTFLWRDLVGSNPFKAVYRLAWAALRTMSKDPRKVISVFKVTGKNCFIHHSAVVEACILGDNVSVGANAVLRGCILGDNVRVEDLAMVEFSVLSDNAVVQRQAMVKFSVLDCGASVGGVVQMGVLGAGSTIKRGAYLMDMSFGGGAKISWNGEIKTAPLGLVGCCLGAETVIGLGVQVAAGRWIPSNRQIVADPSSILQKISAEEEGLYQVFEGGLKKL